MADVNRGFTGIFLPAEIYLNPDLSPLAKLIWGEIVALHEHGNQGGCFAGNEHFAKQLNISTRYVRKHIGELKRLGLVQQAGFDGRKRLLVPFYPNARAELLCHSKRNNNSGPKGTIVPHKLNNERYTSPKTSHVKNNPYPHINEIQNLPPPNFIRGSIQEKMPTVSL